MSNGVKYMSSYTHKSWRFVSKMHDLFDALSSCFECRLALSNIFFLYQTGELSSDAQHAFKCYMTHGNNRRKCHAVAFMWNSLSQTLFNQHLSFTFTLRFLRLVFASLPLFATVHRKWVSRFSSCLKL